MIGKGRSVCFSEDGLCDAKTYFARQIHLRTPSGEPSSWRTSLGITYSDSSTRILRILYLHRKYHGYQDKNQIEDKNQIDRHVWLR